jgi:predicted TIM-barrel fold metal-dependent hydrolase
MEIVDSHVHYWEPSRPERPWDPHGIDLGAPLLVDQLLADANEAGVTKIIQVTPTIMGYDNRYTFECAQKYPERIAGVFARFDPTGDDMAPRLNELRAHPSFMGVRQWLLTPPFKTWLSDGTLDPFLNEAGRQAVPVAIFAPGQAKPIAEAARRHPATRILVDHMAVRHLDTEPFAQWPDVLALADFSNVWIKVSLFPEAAHEPYPYVYTQARFKELFDRFGPDRLIWGSNYPVCKHACTYKQAVDFTKNACGFLSEADKEKIFGATFFAAVGRSGG